MDLFDFMEAEDFALRRYIAEAFGGSAEFISPGELAEFIDFSLRRGAPYAGEEDFTRFGESAFEAAGSFSGARELSVGSFFPEEAGIPPGIREAAFPAEGFRIFCESLEGADTAAGREAFRSGAFEEIFLPGAYGGAALEAARDIVYGPWSMQAFLPEAVSAPFSFAAPLPDGRAPAVPAAACPGILPWAGRGGGAKPRESGEAAPFIISGGAYPGGFAGPEQGPGVSAGLSREFLEDNLRSVLLDILDEELFVEGDGSYSF